MYVPGPEKSTLFLSFEHGSKVLHESVSFTPPTSSENGVEIANAAIKKAAASSCGQRGLQKLQ